MARPDLDERFRHSKLHRYLLADEQVVVAQRQHWAKVAEPVASAVAGLFVVLALDYFLAATLGPLINVLWWAWFFLVARAIWKWFEWRRNWLVGTDKRIMVNYGLIHQGVSMFSLSRVPDLTYSRSSLGQILGYGELERESTGDRQTLHKVRFVEHPHATYTAICAAIFNLQDRMFGMEEYEHQHRLEDGPPPHTPGLVITPGRRAGPSDFRDDSDESEEPPGIRIHYGVSPHQDRDSWRQSADLRDSSLRDADTGPIPYRRSATDESDDWLPKINDKDHDTDQGDHGKDPDTDHDHDHHR